MGPCVYHPEQRRAQGGLVSLGGSKPSTLHCSFSREVWFKVLHLCGLQTALAVSWWITSCKLVPKSRRKAVDSLIILVA
jgi:hypothetical protein